MQRTARHLHTARCRRKAAIESAAKAVEMESTLAKTHRMLSEAQRGLKGADEELTVAQAASKEAQAAHTEATKALAAAKKEAVASGQYSEMLADKEARLLAAQDKVAALVRVVAAAIPQKCRVSLGVLCFTECTSNKCQGPRGAIDSGRD